jgi:hypothetical protein
MGADTLIGTCPTIMKTCPYCKLEIPVDAEVCGYCQRDQPRASVPKTPEQIQSEKAARRGCLIFAGAVVVLIGVVGTVMSVSDSIDNGRISAEIDRKNKIEQHSSTETAKAILPGINRYADLLEGKIQISAADHTKEAEKLRVLADIANKEVATMKALGWGGMLTAKIWWQVSMTLTTDANIMEGRFANNPEVREDRFAKMKPSERSESAHLHRKLFAVLEQHANEGFVNCAALETDLCGVLGDFAPRASSEPDKYQRYVSEHPELCADRTAAQCAELPGLMKQACDGLGGCADSGVQ